MNRSGSSQAAAVGSGSYEERNRSSRRQQRIAITNHIRSNSSGPARIRYKQMRSAAKSAGQDRTATHARVSSIQRRNRRQASEHVVLRARAGPLVYWPTLYTARRRSLPRRPSQGSTRAWGWALRLAPCFWPADDGGVIWLRAIRFG